MKTAVMLVALTFALSIAQAQPLTITQVSAPSINCVYNLDCTVVVKDIADDLVLSNDTTIGSLQSRTVQGQPLAPLVGLYGYEYRGKLQEREQNDPAPCLETFTIDFDGAIVPFDYNGDGASDDIYVITSGGLGTIAPVAAERIGNRIVFHFPAPFVCAGDSTFFFGFTSTDPPA